MSWHILETAIETRGGTKYQIEVDEKIITRKTFFQKLAEEETWQQAWIDFLKALPHEGYYWEVPPSTDESIQKDFEFVVIPTIAFGRKRPAFRIFKDYFQDELALAFPNLSGDAMLVVPNQDDKKDFSHLAAFMQNADEDQLFSFWQLVAVTYLQQLGDQNKWLSTAGLGVAWLHLRIDSRPKYYKYAAYRNLT